jgi:hypothetical protein
MEREENKVVKLGREREKIYPLTSTHAKVKSSSS